MTNPADQSAGTPPREEGCTCRPRATGYYVEPFVWERDEDCPIHGCNWRGKPHAD
jgi:hypothetical protein